MNIKDTYENNASDPEIGFPHKIDFRALWPRNGNTGSVGVKSANSSELSEVENFKTEPNVDHDLLPRNFS